MLALVTNWRIKKRCLKIFLTVDHTDMMEKKKRALLVLGPSSKLSYVTKERERH